MQIFSLNKDIFNFIKIIKFIFYKSCFIICYISRLIIKFLFVVELLEKDILHYVNDIVSISSYKFLGYIYSWNLYKMIYSLLKNY